MASTNLLIFQCLTRLSLRKRCRIVVVPCMMFSIFLMHLVLFKYLNAFGKIKPIRSAWWSFPAVVKNSKARTVSTEALGIVNIDKWHKVCSLNMNSLRQFPLFPKFPNERHYIVVKHYLSYDFHKRHTAVRIMGYLHPPTTGYYIFHIFSSTMAELWLSNTWEPMHATRIAVTSAIYIDDGLSFQACNEKNVSERIYLTNHDKYYFEVLIAVNNPPNRPSPFALYWTLPGGSVFTNITGNDVSGYFENFSLYKLPDYSATVDNLPSLRVAENEDHFLGKMYPLSEKKLNASEKPKFTLKQDNVKNILGEHLDLDSTEYDRENVGQIPYLSRSEYEVIRAFPKCTYEPTFTKNLSVGRYEGRKYALFIHIFPPDFSDLFRCEKRMIFDIYRRCDFHDHLKEETVVNLVNDFMDKLNPSGDSNRIYNWKLNSIINIEKYSPAKPVQSPKYLIELILRRKDNGKLYRFSEFFTQETDKHGLCLLENIRWNSSVWINVILTVKNQPRWAIYFVEEMARILKESREQCVFFIIVDYGHEGVDIDEVMKSHGIKHFSILKRNGTFHKTSNINAAVSQIKDPNSIIFLTDLHFKMPLNLFDVIRKHTIQGKTGFAPQVMRLNFCGRPRRKHVYPEGFYEPNGFGVFSIYKSDWDIFGGMNEEEFRNKWGGEDWEMVDRIINKGYEIEKTRLPGFYHFYHDKKGMWNH